ncbi:GNAT family acetyltransferase [Bifidobacterium lemurum]|uniref:GNAT family acetyltransferase n=1 Tax=Bifidobacterium lemurum TaxID=1603886 RepID=A0A261FSY7_9BIFI|nr:GNAT family N-acetyltransferase [Bifidobacterium lemurum]OZG61896.1 GNAT family acetyltransferase [Bifidobacterium lemurum]QOL33310.1 GNAT N-acetyltransferase [Bifidobacterium lemurum]
MIENTAQKTGESSRELPARIVIPPIRGEMVHLRPATVEDLLRLDELDAFYGASKITGKDAAAERALVHAWVRRSVAWMNGQQPVESGVGDPESRRTVAWAILTDADHDDDGETDAPATDNVIGMIFLIDVDAWSRSARIQVILGRDYRGRGYSRDAMPRVMTFGFAPQPVGLGMHRIWVGVPEKNSRSNSVYRSLGFVPSGVSRDALWDTENNKYQDLIVMDTLVDEYDPIRSLDAFGMHVFEDNPGVKEALSAREHSLAIQQTVDLGDGETAVGESERFGETPVGESRREDHMNEAEPVAGESDVMPHRTNAGAPGESESESNWPYGQSERKTSKDAWWRTLGRGRKRDTEGK